MIGRRSLLRSLGAPDQRGRSLMGLAIIQTLGCASILAGLLLLAFTPGRGAWSTIASGTGFVLILFGVHAAFYHCRCSLNKHMN